MTHFVLRHLWHTQNTPIFGARTRAAYSSTERNDCLSVFIFLVSLCAKWGDGTNHSFQRCNPETTAQQCTTTDASHQSNHAVITLQLRVPRLFLLHLRQSSRSISCLLSVVVLIVVISIHVLLDGTGTSNRSHGWLAPI